MTDTLLVSDLHLSPHRPAKMRLFRKLFDGPARRARAVYILGDLFDKLWLGDDDRTPPAEEIIEVLRNCCRHNERVFLVRGNRDLMLGAGFSALTGCRLLDDETVIDIDGNKTLIMHGDLLCTEDRKYQLYRRWMERPWVRRLYLSLPLGLRAWLTHGLQFQVKKRTRPGPARLADVNQQALERALARHKVAEIIHGHTHRPGFHLFEMNGQSMRRIILGDWYAGDSVLVCRNGEKRLVRVQQYLASC